ncbi:MAG: carboxypeptidase regulatory-like domain-containing protein [Terriglobales bacterium]
MRKRIFFCAGAILALSCLIFAQNITATLSGTVTDPSGAVVPGASITVLNNANGGLRRVTTGSQGSYSVSNLAPGVYTVTVSKSGFQTFQTKNVILQVGQPFGLPVRLKTGTVTQTVEVSTTTAPVQLETGAQISTVSGHQIRQLELDNRNFEQLVALQPGVTSNLGMTVGFGMANTTNLAVDGARQTMNNWTVDGADINDTGSNSTILNVPSVDALQEFSIAGSGYSAKYGRSGGGQINVVTKSGTDQFHGDAYEFVRNNILNANDFFANASNQPIGIDHYNDYGFTFGGPLLKNKTFFFWSEEWRKESAPSTYQYALPNPQALTGNFTGLYYTAPNATETPVTLNAASAPAGCITGNVVSPNCFSSNAEAYIKNIYSKLTPAPGACLSGGEPDVECYPYTVNLAATNNTREDLVRLDQNVGQNIQLFARYMGDNIPTTEPGGLFNGGNLPGVYPTSTDAPGRNWVFHAVEELTPNLVNEAAFNYSWGGINSVITGVGGDASGFSGLSTANFPFQDPYNRIPGISISQVTGVGLPSAPYHERNIDKQVYDNLSWTYGNQTISTGVTLQDMEKTENADNNVAGALSFGDEYGNPGLANFLLGYASSFGASSRDIVPDLHFANFGTYLEDDWKVTPTLTVNLGIRYQYLPTPYDSTGILDNFDPATFNPAAEPAIESNGSFAPGGVVPAHYINGIIIADQTSPFGANVNPNNTADFAPRLGFSWDPFGHGTTAVRGGWGLYFDRTLDGIWEENEFADPPFLQNVNITTSTTTPFDLFDDPNGGSLAVGLFPESLTATGDPAYATPRIQDWSLSLEHEFANNTRVQVAYVGNHASDLLLEEDLNQIPLTALAGETGCVSGGAAPVGTAASTCPEEEALRPYLGYQQIQTRTPAAISNYDSLQASVKHQVGRLTLDAAYTWSKDLSYTSADRFASVLDTYDYGLDYGPVSFNRPQVFVLSYIYDLPNFDLSGWARNAFGGWEWSGITTLESGTPMTISQYVDPFNCDDYTLNGGDPCPAGTYPGGIGIDYGGNVPRPDLVGNPNGPKQASEWFNTSAFDLAVGHWGTAGNGIVMGPGMDNWDMALMKNFQVGERVHAQLRGEFFNTFNHVNFNSVSTTLGSSNFGQLDGDQGPRQIQLGLKLVF